MPGATIVWMKPNIIHLGCNYIKPFKKLHLCCEERTKLAR